MLYPCMKNLQKNQEAVINAIAEAYETGLLEDPHHARTFINILALVCEDKVEGSISEEGVNKWRLTDWYADQIDKIQEGLGL